MIPSNLRRDRSISDTRYIGSVCAKHPEQQGERNKRNHECVGCRKDMNKRYRASESGKAARRKRQRNLRYVQAFDCQILRDIEDRTRLKGMDLSLSRFGNVEHWKELWDEAKLIVLKEMGLDTPPEL